MVFAIPREGTIPTTILDGGPDETARCRRRIRAYVAAAVTRTVGWYAGVAAALTLLLAIPAGAVLLQVDAYPGILKTWMNASGMMVIWGTLVWSYLYFLVGVMVPSTRIGKRIREIERLQSPSQSRITRHKEILILQASGVLARVFFRVITRRTLHAGVRPDLTTAVATLSKSIMLALPNNTLDSSEGRQKDIVDYTFFLRSVLGALVVERLDALPVLAAPLRERGILLGDNDDEEMRRYLQPFVRRSTLEVLTEFAFPAFAILLSTAALVVSLVTS